MMGADGSTSSEVVEPTQQGEERLSENDLEEFLNTIIAHEKNQREWGKEIDPSIPWDRATWSWEYRKCASQNCKCKFGGEYRHGPYLIMVWKDKDNNKVKKKYLGKSKDGDMNIYNVLENLSFKKACESRGLIDRDHTLTKFRKGMAIMEAAKNGNELAQEYAKKGENGKVSMDWAYKKVFKINNSATFGES